MPRFTVNANRFALRFYLALMYVLGGTAVGALAVYIFEGIFSS